MFICVHIYMSTYKKKHWNIFVSPQVLYTAAISPTMGSRVYNGHGMGLCIFAMAQSLYSTVHLTSPCYPPY